MEDGHMVAKHGGGGREEPRKEETRHTQAASTLHVFEESACESVTLTF